MKTSTIIKTIAMACCLSMASCGGNNGSSTDSTAVIDYKKPFEHWVVNEFFGTDLNKSGQVEKFHNLLESGVLYWNKTNLCEWDSGITDYELSNGKLSTTVIFEGSVKEAEEMFEYVDAVLVKRYENRQNYQQEQWQRTADEFCISYVHFYDYEDYRIGVTFTLYAEKPVPDAASRASVRIGLSED